MKRKFILILFAFLLGCATLNYRVGDTIYNYPLEVTLKAFDNPAFLRKGTEKVFPHQKQKFIIVLLEIQNVGTEDLEGIGSLVWDKIYLLDNQGYKYNPVTSYRYKSIYALKRIDLSSGEKTKGQILFEIPKQSKGLSLIYKYEYGYKNKVEFEWKLERENKK
ncbi:MAG: DUF4352 domain-containing protein [Elusimicrobia bacterium]|nr:DUF4352 domain-containing protein [Elusimicrobiota bacterium]